MERNFFCTPFLAATELSAKVYFENSNNDIIGLDGVSIDHVKVSIPISIEMEELGWAELHRLVELVRLFNRYFRKRTKNSRYPTLKDSSLAFARCLLVDNMGFVSKRKIGGDISPEVMFRKWEDWYECFLDNSVVSGSNSECSTAVLKASAANPYTPAILNIANGRRYIVTKLGYIGIGPRYAEEGDAFAFSTVQVALLFFEKQIVTNVFPMDKPELGGQISTEMMKDGRLLETFIFMAAWIMRW
jgi:hypothetical protein